MNNDTAAICFCIALGVLVAIWLYFLPWKIARSRSHRNVVAIFVANLLFGWTFLGWALCLVWACLKGREEA